jgi:hydrogenase expression/formation protein HypC
MNLEVPGTILEIYTVRKNRLALVQFGETRRPVFLDLVPEAQVGDFVTVHVGFATARVNPEEAKRANEALTRSGVSAEAELELEEAAPAMMRRSKPR